MAISNPITIATGECSASTTLVLTVPVGGVPANSLIFVCIHGDNNVTPTISDSKGNSYNLVQTNNPNATTASKFTTRYVIGNTALVSGDTITISWGATSTNGVASAQYATGVRLAAGPNVTGAANGSSGSPTITSGAAPETGELFWGCLAVRGAAGDSFTQASTFATPPDRVDHSTAAIGLRGGFFINPAATAKTYNPTMTSRDWAAQIILYRAAPGSTVTAAASLGANARAAVAQTVTENPSTALRTTARLLGSLTASETASATLRARANLTSVITAVERAAAACGARLGLTGTGGRLFTGIASLGARAGLTGSARTTAAPSATLGSRDSVRGTAASTLTGRATLAATSRLSGIGRAIENASARIGAILNEINQTGTPKTGQASMGARPGLSGSARVIAAVASVIRGTARTSGTARSTTGAASTLVARPGWAGSPRTNRLATAVIRATAGLSGRPGQAYLVRGALAVALGVMGITSVGAPPVLRSTPRMLGKRDEASLLGQKATPEIDVEIEE